MSQRRTRAMGQSPGGFRAIDLNAPTYTRKTRQTTVPQVTVEPASIAPRAEPAPKAKAKPASKAKAKTEPKAKPKTEPKAKPKAKAKAAPKRKKTATDTEEGPTAKRTRHEVAVSPHRSLQLASPKYLSPSRDQGYIFQLPENPAVPSDDMRSSQNGGSPLENFFTPPSTIPKESTPIRAQPSPDRGNEPRPQIPHISNAPKSVPPSYGYGSNPHHPAPPTREEFEQLSPSGRLAYYKCRNQEFEGFEKALSECSDDEYLLRLPLQMMGYRTRTLPHKINVDEVSWVPGATAMFSVRGDELTRPESKARRISVHLAPREMSPPRLATRARPLTRLDVIAAVSASIDWFEDNPSAIPPTPAEMSSMLDDFLENAKPASLRARARSVTRVGPSPPQTPRRHLSPITDYNSRVNPSSVADPETRDSLSGASKINKQTPTKQQTIKDWGKYVGRTLEKYGHHMVSDNLVGTQESTAPLTTNNVAQAPPNAPTTPGPHRSTPAQLQSDRTWASAFGISSIGSVLRTPVNWLSRRPDRQIASSSEPRPTALTRPPRRLRLKSGKPTKRKLKAVTTKPSTHQVQPLSAKPASPPRVPRGRRDAHLPVHLRGVRYEDLSREWQAKSQHLKPAKEEEEEGDLDALAWQAKSQHLKPSESAEEEKEVDLDALYTSAEQNRRRWGLPEKEGAVDAAIRACYEGEEYDQNQPVGSKRKVVVRFSKRQAKVFNAKVGPSSFGVPMNIDDTSSEEEVDVEYDEDDPERLFRRSDHRAASPVKSCLKGSRDHQAKRARNDDGPVSVDWSGVPPIAPPSAAKMAVGYDWAQDATDDEPVCIDWFGVPCVGLPSAKKKAVSWNWAEDQANDFRARRSNFISTPLKEATQLANDRDDFEELHPLEIDDPQMRADLEQINKFAEARGRAPNIFWKAAMEEEERRSKMREQKALKVEAAETAAQSATRKAERNARQEAERKEVQELAQKAKERDDALKEAQEVAQKVQELAQKAKERDDALKEAQELAQKAKERDDALKEMEQKQKMTEQTAILEKPILRETPHERLNKLRERAQPHKPVVPSGLHVTKTLSPIHEPLRMIGNVELDPEVLEALDAIPDSEIVAESFAHIPYVMDPIVASLPASAFNQTV